MARILIGNIKGPKGDKGEQGDQGPVGPQGPAGAKGEKGDMPALVKELTATEEGVAALDAVVGKILNDKITQLNSDLNDRTPVGDLQVIADTNGINSRRIVQCGANTLNTPYKEGLTLGAEGTAYINMSSPDYGTIYYVVSGGNEIYLRSKDGGKWSSWTCVITNAVFNPVAITDLNNINPGFNFSCYSSNTLNSPYKSGLTGNTAAGGVISFGYANYGAQIAVPAGTPNTGNNLFVRTMANGIWSDWEVK